MMKQYRKWRLAAVVAICISLASTGCTIGPATPGEARPVAAKAYLAPTSERQPEAASSPTSTAAPITTKSSANPVADPEPIYFSGAGQYVTEAIRISRGIVRIVSSHSGGSNFIVKLLDADTGEMVELVTNEIGSYDGTTVIGLETGDYVFDVDADGPWRVTVEQPRNAPVVTDTEFTGYGAQAIGPIRLKSGLVRFTTSHDGSSNFIVWLLESDGDQADLIANEIGPFEGTSSSASNGGRYWLSVAAEGNWTLSIS